ncbi:MAG: hypothetical protein J07HQX50_00215 [Haloquadratum sp. J07HQX50]|nr:MAG: hypothetical protein J07HQX50_00215 [Haloquadratum sp. J07HQX50]
MNEEALPHGYRHMSVQMLEIVEIIEFAQYKSLEERRIRSPEHGRIRSRVTGVSSPD